MIPLLIYLLLLACLFFPNFFLIPTFPALLAYLPPPPPPLFPYDNYYDADEEEVRQ